MGTGSGYSVERLEDVSCARENVSDGDGGTRESVANRDGGRETLYRGFGGVASFFSGVASLAGGSGVLAFGICPSSWERWAGDDVSVVGFLRYSFNCFDIPLRSPWGLMPSFLRFFRSSSFGKRHP